MSRTLENHLDNPTFMTTESTLYKIKQWYWENWPLCLFCNHRIRKEGDLAHIIRRSWSTRYQTLKLNTGLAHRACHDIFDNDPHGAVCLPRFNEVMFIGYLIDPGWMDEQKLLYPFYEFPDFEAISNRYGLHLIGYDHHGELLFLPHE